MIIHNVNKLSWNLILSFHSGNVTLSMTRSNGSKPWLSQQNTHKYALYLSFVLSWYLKNRTKLRPFKYECHLVALWLWPLICDLEKSYLIRSPLVMCNLEIRLRYSHLFPRYWPKNLNETPCLKYGYRGQYSKSSCDGTDDIYIMWYIIYGGWTEQ